MIHLLETHRADMTGLETRIFNMLKIHSGHTEPDLSWMDLHKLMRYSEPKANKEFAIASSSSPGSES